MEDGISDEAVLLQLAQLYVDAGDLDRAREVLIELEARDAAQRQPSLPGRCETSRNLGGAPSRR